MTIAGHHSMMGGKLPYKTELEYIECDGNSYVVLPNNLFYKQAECGVELTLSTGTAVFSAISVFLGATNGLYNSPYYVRFSANGETQFACPGANWNVLYSDANIHTIKAISDPSASASHASVSVDNGTATMYTTTTSNVFQDSVGVFADIYGNNRCPRGVRFYSARGFNGNNTTSEIIPVLDRSDVACVYDRVSGRLFYNAGTGAFLTPETNGGGV